MSWGLHVGDRSGKLRELQRLPLFAALLLVLALAGLGIVTAIYENRQDLVRHTHEVESSIGRTASALQDVELAVRGFGLTGSESYRKRVTTDHQRFQREVEQLATLTADNPAQQETLAQLRRLATEQLDRNAGLFRGDPAGSIVIQTVSLDPIRETVAQLYANEADLLDLRTKDADLWRRLALIGVAISIGAAVVMFLLWLRDRHQRGLALAGQEAEAEGRRKAEAQLNQLQKMEAVGRLTGGIAHDFNNMLAVILSAISLIQRRLATGKGDIGPLLDAARDGATRASTLTARLLAFSRQQPLAPQPINASRMVSGMQDLLQRALGEHIMLETVLGGGLWSARADPSQLENAVVNLAVNARDAMPNGGRLTIETANVALDETYARDHQEVAAGQYVMVAVSDNGTGMSPDVAARAFEPFFTTKGVGQGTGLGLSQVYGFIKQSGGHVKIYSEIGQGTTIKLYLPRHHGEASDLRKPQLESEIPAGDASEVILVVEDDDHLREIAATTLREMGYTVIPARSGREALRILDQRPEICCLFTDVVMPEMSGRELADEATARRPDLKVLYTTGYTRNAIIHGGVLDPGVNLLVKPFTAEDLARKVREVLGPKPQKS